MSKPKSCTSEGGQTRSVRWDNHVCLPFGHSRKDFFPELDRHRLAGFSVASVNIGYADCTWEEQLEFATELTDWLDRNDDRFILVKRPSDINLATESNRLGVFFDVEGANLLEGDVGRIAMLYEIGVRWMCLTYNLTNALVGGCRPDAIDDGLTELGRQAIREMNRVGMVVCCSHTGTKSAREIIRYSEEPVIFSHTNSREVFEHWRNTDDKTALLCAESGGVICLNGVAPFLSRPPYEQLVEKVIDQIEHMAKLVGIDHVGIGLDYVYDQSELADALQSQPNLFGEADGALPCIEFVDPESLADLEDGLRARGFSGSDTDKVLGENLLRVGSAVWH